MKIKNILTAILASAFVVGAMTVSAMAADTDTYTVGAGKTYATLGEAVTAAADTNDDGAVTIEIYGKAEVGATFQINAASKTVNIVGADEDAEILVTANPADNGILYVANNAIETLNFSNITLNRPNGEWRGNEGHHNCFFTVWDNDGSTDITYTNCVFPNGAGNNQYGKTTYTGCTFNNESYYALWIYGSGDSAVVDVEGCTFVADRGIKIYSEDIAAEVTTTIENCEFEIASKPAIVSSIAGELTIENVDASECKYGLLASEPKDGNGSLEAAVITVDGETPEFVAKVGNMVCTDIDYAEAEKSDTKPVEAVVAKIGNKFYSSLQSAIEASQNGDEILLVSDATLDDIKIKEKTITFNLNGNTLYVADGEDSDTETRINHINGSNVTYKNGTINIDGANDSVAIFALNVYEGTVPSTVTFDDVVIEGDGYNSGYAVFYLDDLAGNKIIVNNSEIYLANEKGASGGVFKAESKEGIIEITDTVMVLDNIKRGFVNMTTTLTDSEIEFKNLNKTALRNFNGVIAGTYITVDGAEYGIENTSGSLAIEVKATEKNPSIIKIIKSEEEGILLSGTGSVITVADDGSELLAESVNIAEGSSISGNFVTKADAIEVKFVKADTDGTNDTKEDEDLYNINLVGASAEIINRLNSVDLTFTLTNTSGENIYEIVASNDEVSINEVSEDRYEFHYDGKTDVDTDTADTITIGQVKITGYGTYTFAVDADADTNVAHATTISDNIVDTFIPNDDEATVVDGELVIADAINATIEVPTRTLTIKVDFPNAVEKNVADYQQMTVTVSGGDLTKDIVVDLGKDAVTEQAIGLEAEKANANYSVAVADGYTVTVTDALTLNTAYTVTVEGAGYRTYRYTVTMTEEKTLNFWNNVKDNDTVVEKDKKTAKVTYLAGDIVKDSVINIYDLSAVVSYFGEAMSTTEYNAYAKYDLNRDGKIDSKDVAYVLVSWGN